MIFPLIFPRLLDQFRVAARAVGQAESWIETLAQWVVAYIIFHGKRHPRELGPAALDIFLQHVVQTRKNPLAALEAARTALHLLYQEVLKQPIGELPQPRPPLLFDQMRQVLRLGPYAATTEENYVWWAKQYILFHDKRHPRDMRAAEVEQFLTHLATAKHVSASSQNSAGARAERHPVLLWQGSAFSWRGSRLARVDPASVVIHKSILKNGLRLSCGKRLRKSGWTLAKCGLAWLGSDTPFLRRGASRLDNDWLARRGGRLPPATTTRSRKICHPQ